MVFLPRDREPPDAGEGSQGGFEMKSWPYFPHQDLASPDTGMHEMDERFMLRLVLLRQELGFPLIVTSAYRSPEHNAKVGGVSRSAHLSGRAVDIAISGAKAHRLVRMALLFGFTGIGVRQRGDHRLRFVHLDDLDSAPDIPRPAIWSY